MPFLPHPRLHVGCASISWAATLSCLGLCALCKYDVIHKTGSTQSIASPQEKDRATAMRNMQKKSGKCKVLLNISPYFKHTATLSCEILALSDSKQPMATSFCDTQYNLNIYCQLLLLHPFNDLFSRTTWVSRYQKRKTSLDLNEPRDYGVLGCSGISWTICEQSTPGSRQIITSTPYHSIFTGRMLSLMPNQQCQSNEGMQQ